MISEIAKRLRRVGSRPARSIDPDILTNLTPRKFNSAAPTPQAAADIFRGHWASDLSQIVPGTMAGPTGLFDDPRVGYVLERFAGPGGDLHGQLVLELGPLEGAHTCQLEKLGASVTAIEANTEAFLKCLIVKELAALTRARFLYGDFVEYLRKTDDRFDLVFCCGVLYHMADPIDLIAAIAAHTNRVFVWTHHYVEGASSAAVAERIEKDGQTYTYYRRQNVDRHSTVYWGCGQPTSALMSRNDIVRAFAAYGFVYSHLHHDEPTNAGGPAISVSFWKG